jgi:hypothetical protein
LTEIVRLRGEAFPLSDTLCNPLRGEDFSTVELVETRSDNFRLDLVGETLMLVYNKTTMDSDFF